MVRTTIVEHQELTEFGYMPSNRQIITESCKCSFLEQELAKLKAENEKLKAELFNQKEHYEVLKENYDNVFIFMAEKTDRTISKCFDMYKDWLVK